MLKRVIEPKASVKQENMEENYFYAGNKLSHEEKRGEIPLKETRRGRLWAMIKKIFRRVG